MKKQTILSVFFWVLIFLFIGFLFLRNDDSRENETVLKSTKLIRSYDKEISNLKEFKIEKDLLDYGNDRRDRKVVERFREDKSFVDSLEKAQKLDWFVLFDQLVQSSKDSVYSYYLIDSLLYSYSELDSKSIFHIHQNLLYHRYINSLEIVSNKIGGFHSSHFGDYIQIFTVDYLVLIHSSSATYTNFILEPHFDKPKYYSTNFIFNKDSVIRFQTITKTFMNGEKIERTKRYEITPTNGQILSPLSYKEIKK